MGVGLDIEEYLHYLSRQSHNFNTKLKSNNTAML